MVANPQKENGYTPISNEIMEALAMARIPGEARQILDIIIRKTYGFNKKIDRISTSQFMEKTKLSRKAVHRARRNLKKMNIITIFEKVDSQYLSYCLQKNYHSWILSPKKHTVSKNETTLSPKKETDCPPKSNTQKTIYNNNNTKDITSQISDLQGKFSITTQEKIKVYMDRVRDKNKSKVITDGRKLTLLIELYNTKGRCNDDNLFNYALEAAIGYDAPCIGYINAVIKNKKTARPK